MSLEPTAQSDRVEVRGVTLQELYLHMVNLIELRSRENGIIMHTGYTVNYFEESCSKTEQRSEQQRQKKMGPSFCMSVLRFIKLHYITACLYADENVLVERKTLMKWER